MDDDPAPNLEREETNILTALCGNIDQKLQVCAREKT